MSDQNWNDIGKQIREAVQGALVSGDFKEMNQVISESVNKAVAEAKKQTGRTTFKERKQDDYRVKHPPRIKTKKVGNADIASRVSVQLQLTDPNARSRDRIVKKGEKAGLFTALDFGSVWLERALAGK